MALRAEMPNLRGLMKRGAFTFWAETTDVAVTLPSHTSMLTGVTPEKHGIHWNSEDPGKPAPIAAGPGVRRNYDLTRDQKLVVATYDTFATACYFLGIERPEGIEGKPVGQIFGQEATLSHVAR